MRSKFLIDAKRLLLFLGLLCLPFGFTRTAHGSSNAEERAFASAFSMFEDHQFTMAETNFAAFISNYQNSTNRPSATLYLARARLEESNYNGALFLLTNFIARAGDRTGDYVFWIARTRLDQDQGAAAAEGFANLIKNFTNSPRLLEAASDQAEAYFKMRDWMRVIELLQPPQSAFRRLAAADPQNPFVAAGLLHLAEADLAAGKLAAGETVLRDMDSSALSLERQWRRLYLLGRLELASGQLTLALQTSSNLLDNANGPRHQAASRFLRGQILEKLQRLDDALASYTNNLAPELPAEDQREALLRTITLELSRQRVAEAQQLLENYIVQRTNSAALDLARLSLAELYLKIHYGSYPVPPSQDPTAVATNYLDLAATNFYYVLNNFPNSPLAAQAHLDLGWCYWTQTNLGYARAEFQIAADTLPFSPEEAVARFKLADAEFSQHDYISAVSNYNLLLRQYASVPAVTNGLFDQALYQIAAASLALDDLPTAQAALKNILDNYPASLFGDRGQLLLGESKRYDYAMARRVFRALLERSPGTPLLPEVQYAIARTYEQEGNWPEALSEYNLWLKANSAKAPALLPEVEYERALVFGKAGQETNALMLFTNFATRFPSNSLAPWAQNWVADYYFNQGDNEAAERNYQLLFQLYPNAGDLPYQARLMAGRIALARQSTAEARQYFSDLVANTNAPANLVAQGYFALGDTILQQFYDNPTNAIYFDEAIKAISNLTNGAPTNAMALQAYGQLGNYQMQWAHKQWDLKHDPKVYADAVQMYQTLLNFPATTMDVATRSEAEVALGRIASILGQTEPALAHYCKVIYQQDSGRSDPFWLEQAGVEAAHLYEHQHQWDKAIKVYQRVAQAVPSLHSALDKAILNDQTDADNARN